MASENLNKIENSEKRIVALERNNNEIIKRLAALEAQVLEQQKIFYDYIESEEKSMYELKKILNDVKTLTKTRRH